VPITELDNTYFTVHAALDAYPGVDMPSVDGFSRYATIETVSVHAVPQFVHDVLDYHNGDGNFRMSLDAVSGPYATPPAEPDFAEMQARLLGRTQPQMAALADAVQAVTPTLGVAGVAAFILGLGAAALGDPARVAQALAGFALSPSPAACPLSSLLAAPHQRDPAFQAGSCPHAWAPVALAARRARLRVPPSRERSPGTLDRPRRPGRLTARSDPHLRRDGHPPRWSRRWALPGGRSRPQCDP